MVLGWLAIPVALLVLLRGRVLVALWREPMLVCPVVIVESDDWGVGPPSDADVLESIAAVLTGIRDRRDHPAVMTLGVVLGAPDGAAILASGCQRYHRRTLADPDCAAIVAAINGGRAAGVFALQRHGLEHCWPGSLLAWAKKDQTLCAWLGDPAARSEALPPFLQSRWVDSSCLPSRALAAVQVERAVAEEAALFKEVFGEAPKVAVPNTFVWNDTIEAAWAASGVSCIVTPGRRFEGRDADGALTQPVGTLRNGERGASGAVLIVRDEYFEPRRGHCAEDVWAAVTRKFRLGRPCLLETHRENFIAFPGAGRDALEELERALAGVVVRFPSVLFMTTAELADHLSNPASPLGVASWGAREDLPLASDGGAGNGTTPEVGRPRRPVGLDTTFRFTQSVMASPAGPRG
jgi:hypothetical protein